MTPADTSGCRSCRTDPCTGSCPDPTSEATAAGAGGDADKLFNAASAAAGTISPPPPSPPSSSTRQAASSCNPAAAAFISASASTSVPVPVPAPISSSAPSGALSSSTATPYPQAFPVVPTLVVTSPANYGRFDAENESNLGLIAGLPHDVRKRRARLPSVTDTVGDRTKSRRIDIMQDNSSSRLQQPSSSPAPAKTAMSPLLDIPPEILDTILSHLAVHELVVLSATCRALRRHARSDMHWHRCVQCNVPGQNLTSPGPFASYRDLYLAHEPVWFLPKYKLWFSDRSLVGKLLLVRYDPRRGCIEGYQFVAVSNRSTFEHWPADSEVIIHGFEPKVKLHLDKPILRFAAQDRQEDGAAPGIRDRFVQRPGANRYADEMPMDLDDRRAGMFKNFMLARPLNPETADKRLAAEYPYEKIWPPPTIPARHHVSGALSGQAVVDLSPADRPKSRSEVSNQTFRIRQWMEMAGTPMPRGIMDPADVPAGLAQLLTGSSNTADGSQGGTIGVHLGEEIVTFSTLDPILYTPTPTKPWRGIWVGDYSGHGCEFLLINQPDDPAATDVELGLERRESDTDEEWEARRTEARMYRGRLEAIKLTGDPNVPRGEYTFVADELGPEGFVGIAADPPFAGSRVVKSKGHVAATGFYEDKFIESQLIMISHDRLAQYWVGFGHISFFERVNIDKFLTP